MEVPCDNADQDLFNASMEVSVGERKAACSGL
jgi:hypothetical protein